MTKRITLRGLDDRLQHAIEMFWTTRRRQDKSQGTSGGERDRGGRAAVTAGGHADAMVGLVRELLAENGVPDESIYIKRRTVDLPLFFRPYRDWDLVVVHGGQLVACLEVKSHVGPSFGNNYNNRAQEAVGDGHDLAVAYREGLFEPSPKPWAGNLMLLEDTPGLRTPVRVREAHFPVDPAYRDASYAERYEITLTRLVRESLYDAAALILTEQGPPVGQRSPGAELSFRRLMLSVIGHSLAVISE